MTPYWTRSVVRRTRDRTAEPVGVVPDALYVADHGVRGSVSRLSVKPAGYSVFHRQLGRHESWAASTQMWQRPGLLVL